MKGKTLLPIEKRDLENTDQVQANKNEEDTSNLAKLELVRTQETPQGTGRGTERHKGQRKAKHKHERMQKGHETRWTIILLIRGLIHTLAHQLCQVDRY